MTVKYIQPFPDIPDFKIRKLHKINCANMYTAEQTEWLKSNCIGNYYRDYGCVEFDEEQDAIMFALRWG